MSDTNTPEPRLTPAQALKATEEKVTALESEKTELQGDLKASEQLAEETQTKLTDLQAKFDALETEAKDTTAKVTALESELVTAKEVTDKAVSDKAGELVANLGVAPVAGDKPGDSESAYKTEAEYWKAYNEQHPSEKHAWHQANKHNLANL